MKHPLGGGVRAMGSAHAPSGFEVSVRANSKPRACSGERSAALQGAPAAYMGATHASHGLAREGQPRTVSRRSLRNRIYGGPAEGVLRRAIRTTINDLAINDLEQRRPTRARAYR